MVTRFSDLPVLSLSHLPTVTREQMKEVDELMVDRFGVQIVQMMENAGREFARLARAYLGAGFIGSRITVVAGSGSNGGGGLVAARRLVGWGADVTVVLAGPRAAYHGVAHHQLNTLRAMKQDVLEFEGELPDHDLLLDAVVGYGLHGPLAGIFTQLADAANEYPAPTLSLDVPTGIDVDTGQADGDAITASATMTLALPKTGMSQPDASARTGELFLADIGVPPSLYSLMGLPPANPFSEDSLVRLSREASSVL